MSKTNEQGFEEYTEQSLLITGGYVKGNPAGFNRDIAMEIGELFIFVKSTQPKEWVEFVNKYCEC